MTVKNEGIKKHEKEREQVSRVDKRANHKKEKKIEHPLINADNVSTVFSEAYRSIRTSVAFSLNSTNGGSPCKSILITSSSPSEGKSTTAANLALALAMSGERVLLIDSDLRRPSIYKLFNLDREKGLTNILVDLFDTGLTEGTLGEYGLGDIINLISIQGKSGVLMVSDYTENFQLSFKNGELIDTRWQNRPEEERLASILVTGQKLTEDQKEKVLRQQANCRERLGSLLLNMNLIKPEDLQGPLTLHFSSIINRIFSLTKGHFKFQDNYTQKADTLNYINGNFPSWQKAGSDQATPFLEKNIFSIIKNGPSENLKILTSGPLPSNPSELLNSRRMKTLMLILKGRFDYILLDSPPVNSVTDASILASLVNGVIQVVYVGHSSSKATRRAKQQLDSVGATIFGVVLNRLDLKKDGYYYDSYYRYYRDGYYIKPGDKKSKKENKEDKEHKESPAVSEKQHPVNAV